MKFRQFHHPDISLPVIRRRIGDELLNLLLCYLEDSARMPGRINWGSTFRSQDAYRSAMFRLRKAGLVVRTSTQEGLPRIELGPAAESRRPPELRARTLWRQKWDGRWYVLMYDVPEKQRGYRDALRGFLERMRMGCLQRSVWVTPRDIRPEYDDLRQEIQIDRYAFLLEATTVLGQPAADVVASAWDWGNLRRIQSWYCEVGEESLARVRSDKLDRASVRALAREEVSAYLTVMRDDPLLPRDLLPQDYLGGAVYNLHRALVREIRRRLWSRGPGHPRQAKAARGHRPAGRTRNPVGRSASRS